MTIVITIISFIVVLGILVFFHEFGHYWVARRNGIVVEEFGMGYPPRLVKLFTYDGTVFSINLVPFGGFARMKGEDGADMAAGSFNAASRFGRAATLFAGPFMNMLLAIFLFAASFMAGFPAPAAYPQLQEVATDSQAAQLGLQTGDILLRAGERSTLISPIPDLPYKVWQPNVKDETNLQLTFSRNGEILSSPVADQGAVDQLLSTLKYIPVLDTQITGIAVDSPAQQQGLLPDDLIYKVNDIVLTGGDRLSDLVQKHLGKEITLTVLRDLEWVTIKITPRINPPQGQGSLGVQIGGLSQLATLPPLASLWQGATYTMQYILLVLKLPLLLITNQLPPEEAQISGPIGIAQMIGGAAQATLDTGLWFPIWRLSAILSAALAITNLLPLPALDGGRLLFIAIEVLRGRRINPEREGFVHTIGFMLLLALMVYVTVQDIRAGSIGIDWRMLLGQ